MVNSISSNHNLLRNVNKEAILIYYFAEQVVDDENDDDFFVDPNVNVG